MWKGVQSYCFCPPPPPLTPNLWRSRCRQRCRFLVGTFRSEDDYEDEFSVLSLRTRFEGRHFSKCACSVRKTRTRSPYKRKVVTLNPFTPKIQMLILLARCHTFFSMSVRRIWYYIKTIGTFRSEDEDDYDYEFSVLSMHTRFGGQHFSKCACSQR